MRRAPTITRVETVGGGLICIGVVFFIVSLLSVGLGASETRLRRLLRGTRVIPCGELAWGRDQSGIATVYGRTGPGPEGMLRAPLSGEECVWYRIEVSHLDDGVHRMYSGTRGAVINLTDASGSILVEAELLQKAIYDHDRSDPVIIETLVEGTQYSPSIGFQPGSALESLFRQGIIRPDMLSTSTSEFTTIVTEHIARPWQQLLVMGRVVRHDQRPVVLDARIFGAKGVSSRPLPEIISTLDREIQQSASMSKSFPLIALAFIGVGYVAVWLSRH